jgi:hypothetical protein
LTAPRRKPKISGSLSPPERVGELQDLAARSPQGLPMARMLKIGNGPLFIWPVFPAAMRIFGRVNGDD